MMQIPDAAVQAGTKAIQDISLKHEFVSDEELATAAVTAALPHLPLGFAVKQLDWQEPTKETNGCWTAKTVFGTYSVVNESGWYAVLDDHAYGTEGFEWLSKDLSKDTRQTAFAATQADFERRVRECHVPRPDIKTIIDEIRAGTRQGFLNEGDQPELSDAELSCPHCGGSGHIDDVVTKPIDVATVYREALDRISKFDRSHGSWETIAYDAINIAGRALSAEQVQGALSGITISTIQAAHIERQKEWCPDQQPDLSFRGNEMAGEVGEACNVIKKLERERQGWRGSRSTKEELASELADVIHTAILCAVTAGIDLELATVEKFNATSDKNDLRTRLPAAPTSEAKA